MSRAPFHERRAQTPPSRPFNNGMRQSKLAIVTTSEHLSATDIAAFIDGSLPFADRARAELHLSSCDRCRQELAACARLTNSVPSAPRRLTTWPLIGFAAAVLLIAVVLRPSATHTDRAPSIERASTTASARMFAVFPLGDAVVPRSKLRFTWHRDDRSSGYRVIVIDASGGPTWSEDTPDTVATPPLTVRFDAGVRYFWRVEALHLDGSVAQSAEAPFRIGAE